MSRKVLIQMYKELQRGAKDGTAISSTSQVFRFINGMNIGETVVTNSPANHTYLVVRFAGVCEYREDLADDGMSLTRPVEWFANEMDRDSLTGVSRNNLDLTLTVFNVSIDTRKSCWGLLVVSLWSLRLKR